jgi:transposase
VTQIICGVDVAADTLQAHIRPAQHTACFANTADGIADLAVWCRQHAVALVVMEATGGYERLPFGLLWAAGLPAAVVNPRAVRRFAEAVGWLEKTDRIDAAAIAWYAEVKRIVARPPAPETQQRLAALVTRLRQLGELAVTTGNQRRLVGDPMLGTGFEELAALLARQMRILERTIAELIQADPLWAALNTAFRSIKGVADRTVARLMADLPEIGTLSGKAATKLVGLAPIARDSGKQAGKRSIRGGRASVRSILFIVAEVVRRHDPSFRAFADRLKAAGKPPKVVRIALAHKLLVRLNAKARDVRKELQVAP